jgi:hypothetical protein
MSAATEGRDAALTVIELPLRAGFADVAVLVIGGVAARFELPVDRVDDLLLAVDSLLMQEVVGERIRIETDATATTLAVRIGPFARGQLDDTGLRRVLGRLVDSVAEVPAHDHDGAAIELGMTATGRGGS